MEPTTPTVVQILDPWLNAYAARRTGRRRDRILAVGVRASDCLEAEFDRIATDPERRLIDLERQFGSEKPAGRAIASAALPELILLLTEDRWMPADPQDRRTQIQVLGALGNWMASGWNGWFTSSCSVLTLQAEVDRLRERERAGLAGTHQKEHH